MSKPITVGQFLEYTNYYVPIYIEDEFGNSRYDFIEGTPKSFLKELNKEQLNCPIAFIMNVDGGHMGDELKSKVGICLGIDRDYFEEYFVD